MNKWIIVKLEQNVWLADWDGDPGRTVIEANAKRFPTRATAKIALRKAQEFRPFKNAQLVLKQSE